MEVAGNKYLHALDGGEVGLQLLFSGTVFAGDDGLLRPARVVERRRHLPPPGAVWRETMDATSRTARGCASTAPPTRRSPATGPSQALPDWDLTFERLLKEAGTDDG